MHRLIMILLAAFAVSACVSQEPMLFKPGVSFAKKQNDLDRCRITSFKAVPQAIMTHVSSGYYSPGYIKCHRNRHGKRWCQRQGGYYTPPSSYSYDRNNGLRQRYIQSCLNKKGYNILTLPRCKSAEEQMSALKQKNPALLTCNPDPALQN